MPLPENQTEAEERLCTAVRNGEAVDYTIGDPERDNPVKGADWGPERTLWAEVVRALCIGAWPHVRIDPRGVRISGARVADALDLDGVAVAFPLLLTSCYLEARLRSSKPQLSGFISAEPTPLSVYSPTA